MSNHLKGLLITFSGVLVLSPDTLLIRWVQLDTWALLVYRGLLMAIGIAFLNRVMSRTSLVDQGLRSGKIGLMAAIMFTLSTIAFVNATILTTIAHTLIIVATSPIFAAIFARLFLADKLRRHTLIAIVLVLIGMVVVVGTQQPGSSIVGDLCALLSAICIAATFVLAQKMKPISMASSSCLSGIFTAVIALPFATWVALDGQTIFWLLVMGVVVSVSFFLIMIGPRYIQAAEVGLILPLETVGGTALAWIILHEMPSHSTIIGAAIIMLTLLCHAVYSLLVVPKN